MNVNDIVAEKIAAAARRAEETKRRRAALNAARQRGLAHRHAAKLRRQADARAEGQPDPPSDDDVVTEVTEAEWHDAARTALARLGLTYAELEDQARRRDFTNAQAHSLWTRVGGTITPELLKETS